MYVFLLRLISICLDWLGLYAIINILYNFVLEVGVLHCLYQQMLYSITDTFGNGTGKTFFLITARTFVSRGELNNV